MRLSKKLSTTLATVFAVGLLTAGHSTVHAASAETTISVNLPKMIILYSFDTIDLTIGATAVRDILSGTNCGANDVCVRTIKPTNLTGNPITSGNATVDAKITAGGSTSVVQKVTIQNAFGVRSLGLTTYTTNIIEKAGSDAGGAFSGEAITPGASLTPGLGLTTGQISFNIDLSKTSSNPATVTYTIEVTGI